MLVQGRKGKRAHPENNPVFLQYAEDGAYDTPNLLYMGADCNYWWEYSLDLNLYTLLPQYEEFEIARHRNVSPYYRISFITHLQHAREPASH